MIDPITLELLAQTAVALKRLPEYERRSLSSLVEVAHEFLLNCQGSIRTHESGSVTYLEAIRYITGYARIREKQMSTFERFFRETQIDPDEFSRGPWQSPEVVERQLAEWKTSDSVPLKTCAELAPAFNIWRIEQRKKKQKNGQRKNSLD